MDTRPFPSSGYRLTTDERGFILEADAAFIERFRRGLEQLDPEVIESIRAEFNLLVFEPQLEGDWGFQRAMRRTEPTAPGTWRWHAPWPAYVWRGKEQLVSTSPSHALSSTLAVFSLFVKWEQCGGGTQEDSPWSFEIFPPKARLGGSALVATLPARTRTWIREGGDRDLPEVIQAMHVAFNAIWNQPTRPAGPREFQARVWNGYQIDLKVPGNCACFGVNWDNGPDGGPLELHPHNIDTPLQQLTLLAGLVRLVALAED